MKHIAPLIFLSIGVAASQVLFPPRQALTSVPAAPAPVGQNGRVTLAWTHSPTTNVVGYEVRWGTNLLNNATRISYVTNHVLTGLTEAVGYKFEVAAVDTFNVVSAPASTNAFVQPKVSLRTHTYAADVSLPVGVWTWQTSTNGLTWQDAKTFTNTSRAVVTLLRTNDKPMELIRIKPL